MLLKYPPIKPQKQRFLIIVITLFFTALSLPEVKADENIPKQKVLPMVTSSIDNEQNREVSSQQMTTNVVEFIALISDVVVLLSAIWGAFYIYKRTIIADTQIRDAKDAVITERISQATEKLSTFHRVPRYEKVNDKWETWEKERKDIGARHAGLISLQRIAIESKKDRLSIMDIICEYISRRSRESEQLVCKSSEEIESKINFYDPYSDIDTALYVLSKLFDHCKPDEIFARNKGFNLRNANLIKSDFRNCNFICVDFTNSDLRFSNLKNSKFIHCSFDNAKLQNTVMGNKPENQTVMTGCVFREADLSDVKDISKKAFEYTFGIISCKGACKLPKDIKLNLQDWFNEETSKIDIDTAYENWQKENQEFLPMEIFFKYRYI